MTSTLINEISRRCICPFSETFISQEQVFCDRQIPTEFVYRATMSSYSTYSTDQLLEFIQEWTSSQTVVLYGNNELTFDPKCLLNISSSNDQLCMTTTPGAGLSFASTIGIALGCIFGGLLIIVMTIILALMCHKLYIRRHSRLV